MKKTDLSWASLIGGRLCLDFVNTLGGTRGEGATEHLTDYDTLLDWAVHAGALDAAQARVLRRESMQHPRFAAEALTAAQTLRESIYWILHAIGHGDTPGAEDVAVLERHVKRALSDPRLVRDGLRVRLQFSCGTDLTAPLDAVARSAAELLASDDLDRVRACESSGCDWVFLDKTKNRSRRWCDMRDCGNRAKARRHYQRTKSAD